MRFTGQLRADGTGPAEVVGQVSRRGAAGLHVDELFQPLVMGVDVAKAERAGEARFLPLPQSCQADGSFRAMAETVGTASTGAKWTFISMNINDCLSPMSPTLLIDRSNPQLSRQHHLALV